MLQHIEQWKRTEIDPLNGAIVRLGRRLGVPTRRNAALAWLIRAAEQRMGRLVREGSPDYARLEAAAKKGAPAREG